MAVIKRTARGVEILVADGAGPRRLRVLRARSGVWIRSSEGGIVLPPEAIDTVVEVLQGKGEDEVTGRLVPIRSRRWRALVPIRRGWFYARRLWRRDA